jgi:hypothetical protein
MRAQEQERKLVDRLLNPETSLQNNAQNKKFTGGGVPITKQATVSAFYFQEKPKPATFVATGESSTQSFNSRSFRSAKQTSPSGQKQLRDSSQSYSTSPVSELPSAPGSHKQKASSTFAGQRPFLERGKSQKSLDRKNPPLTIEQVRELLNKNK